MEDRLPDASPRRPWRGLFRPLLLALTAVTAATGVVAVLASVALRLFGLPPTIPAGGKIPAPLFVVAALATEAGLLLTGAYVNFLTPGSIPLRLIPKHAARTLASAGVILLINLAGGAAIRWTGETYAGMPEIPGARWGVLVTAVAVLVAPAVEEFFFREILLVRLLSDAPVPVAVLFSSLAFGVLHGELGGPILVAAMTGIGLVLAMLRLRTGSLGPSMVAHALNNAAALLLLALAGS